MTFDRSTAIAILVGSIATVVVIWSTATLGSPVISIHDGRLQLESKYHQEVFTISELDLSLARTGAWSTKSPYWPRSRINGNSSTREGIYRLNNNVRAYVVNKGLGALLYLPLTDNLSLVYRGEDSSEILELLEHHQSPPGV